MNKWGVAAIALAYLFVFGLIGSQDLNEEIDQAREYCEMTKSGLWGEYQPWIDCDEILDKTGIEPD